MWGGNGCNECPVAGGRGGRIEVLQHIVAQLDVCFRKMAGWMNE